MFIHGSKNSLLSRQMRHSIDDIRCRYLVGLCIFSRVKASEKAFHRSSRSIQPFQAHLRFKA